MTLTTAPVSLADRQSYRPVHVVLADGEPLFLDGLRRECERGGFIVDASAKSAGDAVRLIRQYRPEVVVLGLVMPELHGMDATRQILEFAPETKVLLLTRLLDERRLADAWRAGACGVALRTQLAGEIGHAISEVAAGRTYVCSVETSSVYEASRSSDAASGLLTKRERQILQLIAEGNTVPQSAQLLGIATKTAAHHRDRLHKKLGVHTSAHLIRLAIRLGLIVP